MNKTELIKENALRTGLSQTKIKEVLNAQEAIIIEAMQRGEKVSLVGFGTYEAVDRDARERRNPKTGEVKMCPAYKAPKFKFSTTVKNLFK